MYLGSFSHMGSAPPHRGENSESLIQLFASTHRKRRKSKRQQCMSARTKIPEQRIELKWRPRRADSPTGYFFERVVVRDYSGRQTTRHRERELRVRASRFATPKSSCSRATLLRRVCFRSIISSTRQVQTPQPLRAEGDSALCLMGRRISVQITGNIC
jgi:hypothetical protein